jgi:hypothetical protein
VAALVLAFLEPDPDADWDVARLREALRNEAELLQ